MSTSQEITEGTRVLVEASVCKYRPEEHLLTVFIDGTDRGLGRMWTAIEGKHPLIPRDGLLEVLRDAHCPDRGLHGLIGECSWCRSRSALLSQLEGTR